MKTKYRFFAAVSAFLLILGGCDNETSPSEATPPAVPNGSAEASPAQNQNGEKGSARVSVEGTKFMVNGKELWINGVNTPWQHWNDFNGGMDEAQWDETFAQLKADGVNCTRIWINCDGACGIWMNDEGEIRTIRDEHWEDLDKLFALAEKHELYIMPTLLSFDHFKSPNRSNQGWRALVRNKETADAFAERYAGEFARRYKDCEYIFAVDLMNEPDWVHENEESGQLSWDELSYFFGKCAAAIHGNSNMLVTVGMGIVKYNSDKYEGNKVSDEYLRSLTGDENAYVDFYSPHYYMWEKPWFGFPFDKSPEDFGMDGTKPCVIAETSNDDDKQSGMSAAEKYRSSYEKGWNGVMVWMEYRSDGSSGCDSMWYRYDLTQEATRGMLETIPEKVFPLG